MSPSASAICPVVPLIPAFTSDVVARIPAAIFFAIDTPELYGSPLPDSAPCLAGENGRNDLMCDATDPMACPTAPIIDLIPPIRPLMIDTPAFHSMWPTSPRAARIMPGRRRTYPSRSEPADLSPEISDDQAREAVLRMSDKADDKNPSIACTICVTIAWISDQAFDHWPVSRSNATLKIPTKRSQPAFTTAVTSATATFTSPVITANAARVTPDTTAQAARVTAETSPNPIRQACVTRAIPPRTTAVTTPTAALIAASVGPHTALKIAVRVRHATRQTASSSAPWPAHQESNPPVMADFTASNARTTGASKVRHMSLQYLKISPAARAIGPRRIP